MELIKKFLIMLLIPVLFLFILVSIAHYIDFYKLYNECNAKLTALQYCKVQIVPVDKTSTVK